MLSKSSKTSLSVGAALFVLLAVVATAVLKVTPERDTSHSQKLDAGDAVSVAPTQTQPSSNEMPTPIAMPRAVSAEDELQLLVAELTNKLVKDHAHEKTDLVFQISLAGLRDDLVSSYPEQGNELFAQILRAAFPELADSILALIAKKDVYDDWLLNAMLDLNEMNLLEQKGTLWAKRYEVFGKEDAEKIWALERNEEEERRETVQTTLESLNDSYGMSMQDRVFLLKTAYEENYFGTLEDVVLDSTGVLSQAIFSLDAVQHELGEMAPEVRQEEINTVRRTLGFDESQIEWLAERDQEREQRWQNGYAYMEERSAVEDAYEGEQLLAQLDQLREKYFKNEAPTIKREEEQLDFYRYNRPRVYGRN